MLGPIDHQLSYLLLAMVVDLIFGIQVARKNKEFSWQTMFNKFTVKVFTYGLWVSMFHAFDRVAGLPDTARWSLILVLVGLEIVSSIKNTSSLGYSRLADALENLYLNLTKGKGGSADEEPTEEKRSDHEAESFDDSNR